MKALLRNVINSVPFLKEEVDFYLFKRRYSNEENVAHRKRMSAFYSQFLKKGDLCFDIGGNIGDFAQAFADCGAKVICLEPQKYCFNFLNKRFRGNDQVVLLKKGAGPQEGEITLHLTSSHTIASMSEEWINKVRDSGRFSEFLWTKSEKVKITTLNKLIESYGKPEFLKIDVEGFEHEVIKGLTEKVKCISFEFTYESLSNTIKIIEHLSAMGEMELNYMQGLTLSLKNDKWMTPAEMISFLKNAPKDSIGDIFVRYK